MDKKEVERVKRKLRYMKSRKSGSSTEPSRRSPRKITNEEVLDIFDRRPPDYYDRVRSSRGVMRDRWRVARETGHQDWRIQQVWSGKDWMGAVVEKHRPGAYDGEKGSA